jgi:hypothetical protein
LIGDYSAEVGQNDILRPTVGKEKLIMSRSSGKN